MTEAHAFTGKMRYATRHVRAEAAGKAVCIFSISAGIREMVIAQNGAVLFEEGGLQKIVS